MHQWCWKYSQSRACLLAAAGLEFVMMLLLRWWILCVQIQNKVTNFWGLKLEISICKHSIILQMFCYYILLQLISFLYWICWRFLKWDHTVFVSFKIECLSKMACMYVKFIYSEKAKNLRNLHQLFLLCTASQIIGGDFAKFYGLLRIYELYYVSKKKDYILLLKIITDSQNMLGL